MFKLMGKKIITILHLKMWLIWTYAFWVIFIIYEPRSDIRDLLVIKVKIEIFTEKKDLSVVNNYRKSEEIIFTNNKDMSV